jgi:PAS domain S-box-containing protein
MGSVGGDEAIHRTNGLHSPYDDQLELLRGVLDATRLLVLVADRAGVVRLINHAVAQTLGLSRAISGRPIWELATYPVERELLRAAFNPFAAESFPSGVMFHLASTGSPPRVIDWDVRLVDDEHGMARVVFTGVDVSDRLAAQERLREVEVFQHDILDRLPAIVWTTDKELRTTFSAGGGLSALGLASGEVALLGTPVYSYFQTDDPSHPGIASHLRALAGESSVFEMNWFERWFHSRIEPLRNNQGQIIGTIGLAFDVTELARTTQALKESEAHLRRLVDANVIGVFFWEESGKVTQANEAFLQLIGLTRDELLSGGISWRALTAPEFRSVDDQALTELKSSGRCAPYEKSVLNKGGERVQVLCGGATFDGATSGKMAGVAFIVDLREHARLRDARDELLRKEHAARTEVELANTRLLLLVEGSKRLSRTMSPNEILETLAGLVIPGLGDWSYIVHRGWAEEHAMIASAHGDPNKQALLRELDAYRPDLDAREGPARVFRTGDAVLYEDVSADQLAHGTPRGLFGTSDPAQLRLLQELGARSVLCVPIAGRTGVDAVMMLVSGSNPHRYDQEDVVLARDLAGRAAASLENGRLLFEALDAVRARDDFLAVAAHELRTPLTSLLLQIQLLHRAIDRDRINLPAAGRSVTAAENQAKRLSGLVDGLLDVARLASNRMGLQTEELDLRELVEGVVSAMAPNCQRVGCPVTVTAPTRTTVRWDRGRIEQVLTNLLSNAIKFGAGQPIEVQATVDDAKAEISVRDHGIGISPGDQARIFGRFERAVSSRHFGGLGLGLYISAQILRAHQGSLRVESQPGQGARFVIALPRNLSTAS